MQDLNGLGDAPARGGVWVLGTDTGVGKTKVSAGLVHALAGAGCRVAGIKPVVSGALRLRATLAETAPMPALGATDMLVWEDVLALEEAGGIPLPERVRNAVALLEPASPHFAAAAEQREIGLAALLASIETGCSLADLLVLEGVGGLRVPVSAGLDMADLVVATGFPVLLVVGLRLGCINHALLTAEALRARGVVLAGWVANTGLDVSYQRVADTVRTLDEGLGVPCAACLPGLPALPALVSVEQLAAYRAGLRGQAALAGLALRACAEGLLRQLVGGTFR